MHGTPYIDISNDKTIAGNRDIPIPELLFKALSHFFDDHDDFGRLKRFDKTSDQAQAVDSLAKLSQCSR